MTGASDGDPSLWLECELWEGTWNPETDFCNMQFKVGAKTYALNVWTFGFATQVMSQGHEEIDPQADGYLIPPDLMVHKLDRILLTEVVRKLIARGEVSEAWRVPPTEIAEAREDMRSSRAHARRRAQE